MEILKWILIIIAGAVIVYLKEYTNVITKITEYIALAEQRYMDFTKSGDLKMQFCIQQLNLIIPVYLKGILTDDVLRVLVQNVFDEVKKYSDIQKQKLADKINAKI